LEKFVDLHKEDISTSLFVIPMTLAMNMMSDNTSWNSIWLKTLAYFVAFVLLVAIYYFLWLQSKTVKNKSKQNVIMINSGLWALKTFVLIVFQGMSSLATSLSTYTDDSKESGYRILYDFVVVIFFILICVVFGLIFNLFGKDENDD